MIELENDKSHNQLNKRTKITLDSSPEFDSLQVYLFLFDLILYVPSTIFQLCQDGSSCVEPVLSKD